MTELPPTRTRTESELVELVHSSDVRAPESLHRQVESLVATHQERHVARRASRRIFSPVGLASAGATLAVVVAVAIAVGLSSGGSAPTVSFSQAAAPTLRAATLPAPAASQTHHTQLAASVDGVKFPYWDERFGWRSTGMRNDRIDGRAVTTVFYSDSHGRRIGYAILAGTPAPRVSGGVALWRDGVTYRILTENGAAVVTWLRDGHLCVVSGHDIPSATLLKLASWSDHGETAS